MNDYTVLIPTTQKVVGITDITKEEKDVLPVVCITNELKPLEISNDYSEKDICDYLNNIVYLSNIEFLDSRNILFFKK